MAFLEHAIPGNKCPFLNHNKNLITCHGVALNYTYHGLRFKNFPLFPSFFPVPRSLPSCHSYCASFYDSCKNRWRYAAHRNMTRSHPAPGKMVRLWSGRTECPTSHSYVAISLPGIVLRFSYPTLTGILLRAYVHTYVAQGTWRNWFRQFSHLPVFKTEIETDFCQLKLYLNMFAFRSVLCDSTSWYNYLGNCFQHYAAGFHGCISHRSQQTRCYFNKIVAVFMFVIKCMHISHVLHFHLFSLHCILSIWF